MAILKFYKRNQLVPIQIGIILTFMLMPLWYRFPGMRLFGMGDFSVFYSAGFLIFWPMLWTVVWWLLSGFAGIKSVWQNKIIRLWIITCLFFAGWVLLSWVWSYKREDYPSVAVSAAVPFILAMMFAITLVCVRIPMRWVGTALIIGLVWNSVLASTQVALQSQTGLAFLGEFPVNPASSGTVVVQAEGIRWLRPYGLLPHPNMLAGFLVVALLAAFVWVLTWQRRLWPFAVGVFTFGLWAFLLTFSRSAWLGFGIGLALILLLTIRKWWGNRKLMLRFAGMVAVMAVTATVFFIVYRPFLAARAGIGGESVELRSTSDRIVYNQIAFTAIQQSPILGTGIGNFPWYAAKYLATETDFDLKGQPVHNIYLSAWSELGIIGLGLFICIIGLTLLLGFKNVANAQSATTTLYYAGAFGAVAAFLLIGLFDHYTWTIIQFQAAFWGVMAVAVQPLLSETNERPLSVML